MMRTSDISLRIIFTIFSIALFSGTLSGCGPLVTLYASQSKFDKKNHTTRPPATEDAYLVETAHRFGLMALFAKVVYRDELSDSLKDTDGCGYLTNETAPPHGMPKNENGKGGWKRWAGDPTHPKAAPCFNENGLYYETYIYEDDDGKIEEAVIAFRGTENRPGQYINDWSSNLVAAAGFEPKQYALVRERIPTLIEKLKLRFDADGRTHKIYATGHSLGGGLAQEAGYLSQDVKEVFTFNTSPVTNWSSLRRKGAVANGYPIFHRVYEGGEILENLRFFSTALTSARFGRHDIGLQFEDRSTFGGHSMNIIACNFAQLIASSQGNNADHHYETKYILDNVLPTGNTKEAEKTVCKKAKKS
jgi:hypothetical protein